MRTLRAVLFALLLAAAATPAAAEPVLIDFEGLGDLDDVTTQFAAYGITFTGATALRSGAEGGTLFDEDFPTFSGAAVVLDSSGSGITIDFLRPALAISGRFTYVSPVTITALSGGAVVGSVSSQFLENIGSGLNPSNELLELAFGGGITQLVIVGDPTFGNSFTLDDFFADLQEEVSPVPEPGAAAFLALGGVMLASLRRLTQRRPRTAALPH